MAADDDDDVLLFVHQVPLDLDDSPAPPHRRRLAHLLPPLHQPPSPSPPSPFRPPPPPQAATSAEPRISFRGWLGAPRHWDLWVAKLRPLHAPLWRRLGIHDAVLASTCRFKRDASSPVLHLACFWSPATNTFAFPWGEATLTLHDIHHLAGLPACGGQPVTAPLPPEWRPDEAALNGVRLGFNRSACKKAHLSAWVKHFLADEDGSATDPILEHAAFLALWLTRFVLPGHPDSTMRQAVFPIAVRLARGDRVALAPAVLASLYRDLRDIKAFLLAAAAGTAAANPDMMSSSSLSLYAPLYILQLWVWERFPVLRPSRENPVRDGEPMAARWHDLSRKINPTLIREAFSTGGNFVWQPYDTFVSGWVRSGDLAGNDELTSLAHCLHPCELVGMDCIEQYLPHRVSRQFGLDQDVPADVPRANQNWSVAWQTYELEGKNVAFFIPHSEPGVTARYTQWWRQKLPQSFLSAGAPTIPAESSSRRKVRKTPAAMEAEAEKERRIKKPRVLPLTPSSSDKKRKIEELYDGKLSEEIEENTTQIPQIKYENLQGESLFGEKCCANGQDVPEKDVDVSREAYKVIQAAKEGCKVLMEKHENNINDALGVELATEGQGKSLADKDIHDHVEKINLVEQVDAQSGRLTRISTEEASQAQENEFDTDMVEESKNSGTLQLKGDQMEVSHEEMMKEQCIQDVELINQREPSSDATSMKIEGLYDHKTLDMHKEMALEDSIITCENRETTIFEGTYILDSMRSNLGTVEVDEAHAEGGIENQECLDLNKQQAMKETEDLGKTTENSQMTMLEVADVIVCSDYQIDPTSMEVKAVDSTKGIQSLELLDNKEQLPMEEKQDLGSSVENNNRNMSEDADVLVCSEHEINPTGMEVNAIESTKGIQSQELLDNKQKLAMEARQDLGNIAEKNKMNVSENADTLVCSEYKVDPTSMEVNASEFTQGIQNQELLDKEEQLALEKGEDRGATIENSKINISQDARVLVCREYQMDATCTEINVAQSTTGIQNKELLDNEEHQVTTKRMDCTTDVSGISFEGANKPGGGGANTFVVAEDVSGSMQNKEACSMEETWEDKQHHGVEYANDKKISEDAIMVDSGELKSDATVVEVNNMSDSSAEKELEVQENQDQQIADENTNRDLAGIDALACGGGKPDGAVKLLHRTIFTGGTVNVAGFKISPKNKQEEAAFEEHDITEVEDSESNQTAGKKPEGTLPPEPDNLVEMKQENLENETEMCISRENDEASGKDQTSAEVIMAPSNVEEQGENDNGWAEESSKSYDKLASDPINTACHQSLRSGNSDIEELKRTQNTRSMYLKDINESLGRIRAEPSSRVRTTSVGYHSRHAVQEPVCKEIRTSARDFARDRAPELVATSPSEETSRWRQEQYALQVLEDVQNSRAAEKTRMEMEIRVLKAQITSMERQAMNLDHFMEVKSRSKRH